MAYNQSARYSTFDYYVRHMLKLDYNWRPIDAEHAHFGWKTVVVILWGLTTFLMTIGLRNYRKFFAGISIVISGLVLLSGVATIYASPNYTAIKGIIGNYKDIVNSEVWMDTFILTMYREVPSDVLTICAVSTPAISTTSDTVIIYSVKIAVNAVSIVWLAMACNTIQLEYNIRDTDCILIQGDLYFFAILPDKLSRMFMSHLLLIVYFLVLFLWNFTVSVNILNSGMEAILEEFPFLAKWRLLMALSICVTLCGLNMPILEHNFMQYFKTYIQSTFTITVVTIIIASLTGMFLYSVQRISNDYHFSYGVKLNKYWTYGIKSSMLVFTIMAILAYIFKSREDTNSTVCIVILWTIPTGMVLMSLRYYMRVNTTLIDPNPQWGPPSRRRKHARTRFDPTHELKCRSLVQQCKHYCLLHSIGIRREIKHWRNKLDLCIAALNEEADADGSLDDDSDDIMSRLSSVKSRDTMRRGSFGSVNTVNTAD